MNLSPVYEKWREETVGQARREEVEALLAEKFGSLDSALTQIVPALLQLSSRQRMNVILHSSRDELLERLGN